ncbi:MAG: peptidase dimerization domain-containing protein [Oscillospiraceae bacterium]|nr:peptidase dimerization domain-containing protein [Oscillospiraceae bacterium]
MKQMTAQFEIAVFGQGGHGSTPHLSVNPLDGFLAIHEALKQYRGIDPNLPCVCDVTGINYGIRPNVIGDTLSFRGCFRGFTQEDVNLFRDRLPQMAQALAARWLCTAEVTFLGE